ncbi:MAG TPA: cobaltochelatase subunit CobT [Rhodospirillaceae bacterium]|nr:cobaltochelatase subunit CobT [Rhodospirillaceae bacterium]
MTTTEHPADLFKRATATAIKAIGHRAEIEVAFEHGGNNPSVGLLGNRVKIPEPSPALPAKDRALVRGIADAAAVRLRYHDAKIHGKQRPAEKQAAAIHDVLEQARCEALGAVRLPGLGSNIGAALATHCEQKGFGEAKSQADAPLADVLHLIAHEALGGQPIPPIGREAVALWKPFLDARLSPHWEKLRGLLSDQKAYAGEVHRLMIALELIEKEDDTESNAPKTQPTEAPQENTPPEPEQEEEERQSTTALSEDEEEEDEDQSSQAVALDAPEEEEGEEEHPDATASSSQAEATKGPVTTYRTYTATFDETIEAQELCPPAELQRLRRLLDYQMRHVQNIIIRLANKLQRRLMAQQLRAWEFDLEEGTLDGARLARIVANPMLPLSFKTEKETPFRDTIVTILIDNSGSMRGRPITLAATSADILARTLERCGVKTEVLGFTTRSWKGGRAREAWLAEGKPARPGRLNELRHVIYKKADMPWRRARINLGLMLREGLLKENIDGEALLWAHSRLMTRSENRRILMVISDGAPVDDATLSVNPNNYLELHLRSVIDWIETRSPVQLVAIGIGHDVTRYYRRAVTITDVDQLGGTMTEQLAALFD